MRCSLVDHYLKLNAPNTIGSCHYLVPHSRFNTIDEWQNSERLARIRESHKNDIFPPDCIRCKQDEEGGRVSRRAWQEQYHEEWLKIREDYLRVNLELDVECNAACPFCDPALSSLFAKLAGVTVPKYDGLKHLMSLGIDLKRIVELDIVGGEPSISKNVERLLVDEVDRFTLQRVRVFTNGSKVMRWLPSLLERGVAVDLMVSYDGTGRIFEYSRWPIKWSKFIKNVDFYQDMREKYPNLTMATGTTMTAFNIFDMDTCSDFAKAKDMELRIVVSSRPKDIHAFCNNTLTRIGKAALERSPNEYVRSFAGSVAIEKEDNTPQLIAAMRGIDAMRSINFLDYCEDYPEVVEAMKIYQI